MKKKVLDITNEKCPMTFLKTRIFIEENPNSQKIIIIKGKKNFNSLKNTLEKNFKIESKSLTKNMFQLKLF
jgi:TusA-related sulfurtransferase